MPLVGTPVKQSGSFRDPSGFVFEIDGRIFRAVDHACLNTVRELRDTGMLGRLIDEKLVVSTSIVEEPALLNMLGDTYPGYLGFLEHQRIEPISYPYEWSASMLADAGIHTLNLQMRLLENGFSLKDATAYNIQFVCGKPVFIDLSSIEKPPRLDVWIALGQFGRMFTYPLLLSRFKGQSLRSYFLANLDGSDVREVRRAFGRLELLKPVLLLDVTLPYWLGRRITNKTYSRQCRIESKETSPGAQILNLKRIRAKLERLVRQSRTQQGAWTNYADICSYNDKAEGLKIEAVRRFLADFKPMSVLDVGCNTGQYAILAAEAGADVVAVDSDHDCIDILYRRVRDSGRPILPLCVDVANPSPAIGFCNRERMSFLQRMDVECVFALAVIHHLHVTANLPITGIRDMFADITRKYLILEFVPPEDVMFQKLMQFRVDLYQEFTLDNCVQTFAEKFTIVRKEPVRDTPRTLLIMRKK